MTSRSLAWQSATTLGPASAVPYDGQGLFHVDKVALGAGHPPVEERRCPDSVGHGDPGGHGFLCARNDADDHGEIGAGNAFRV